MVRLRQGKGVSIKGHPAPAYNGLYTHDSMYEDRPVLKNASGKYFYCYRTGATDTWVLCSSFTPDHQRCNGRIAAKDLGPLLPVGARTWKVKDGDKMVDRMLTLTLQSGDAEVTDAKADKELDKELAKTEKAKAEKAKVALAEVQKVRSFNRISIGSAFLCRLC